MGVSFMTEAITAYRHVAASPEFKELERVRSKARHDEAQALHNAKLQERKLWQGIVQEKDALMLEKDMLIAKLQAQLNNNN